jgi:hypothetical protein
VVLVDQAVEDRSSLNGAEIGQVSDWPRDSSFNDGRSLTAGLVREMLVMVLGVFGEDLGQMPIVEDQHLVEYLAAERSDDPHADRIRPRTLR